MKEDHANIPGMGHQAKKPEQGKPAVAPPKPPEATKPDKAAQSGKAHQTPNLRGPEMPGKDKPNDASKDTADAARGPIGVGAEATEGIHDVDMVGGHERTGLGHRTTGRSAREGAERSGSEPLRERTWVHDSGYGGKGGKPRTSSEQREPAEKDVSKKSPEVHP